MQRTLQPRRCAAVDHNHLFFLNHYTVNLVESNVIALATVFPFELMNSLEIHPIPSANNH